jgi:undecaprenyl-diphosphatase
MKRVLSFFGRRLTPREFLGLHLTLGLLVSLVALACFLIIAHEVVGEDELTEFDRSVALRMAGHAEDHTGVLLFFRFVTNLGGVPAITTLTLLGALLLLARRRWLLATVWLVAAIGGGMLNAGLKHGFQRERPPAALRDVAVTETNLSFPSGHSMGSLIGYGMLGYVLVLRQRRLAARVAVGAGLAGLILLIGCSRVYLRAHWFSDVLGGFAIGTVWLTFCISGLEIVRRRSLAQREARAADREMAEVSEGAGADEIKPS